MRLFHARKVSTMKFTTIDDSKIAAKVILRERGFSPSEGLKWSTEDSVMWQNFCKLVGGTSQIVPDFNRQTNAVKQQMDKALAESTLTSIVDKTPSLAATVPHDPEPNEEIVNEDADTDTNEEDAEDIETEKTEEGAEDSEVEDEESDDLTEEELEALTRP